MSESDHVELDYEAVSEDDEEQWHVTVDPTEEEDDDEKAPETEKCATAEIADDHWKSLVPFDEKGTRMEQETVHAVSIQEHYEYESTIRLPLRYETFTALLKKHKSFIEYVLYFENGVRMTKIDGSYTYQRKREINRDRVLCFKKGDNGPIFVPLVRTSAVEVDAFWPDVATMSKQIVRHVLKKNTLDRQEVTFRYALEQDSLMTTSICCEVEYPHGYMGDYESIKRFEEHLLDTTLELLDNQFEPVCWDTIGFEQLIRVPSRKFYPLHANVLAKTMNVVVKLDGHKGRLVVQDSQLLVYDDLFNVCSLKQAFNNVPTNMVLQFELLAESPNVVKLVITDVLGMFLHGHLFVPDPKQAMDYIQTITFKMPSVEHDGTMYLFDIQRYLSANTAMKALEQTKADGYIIITANVLIKWKIPTVDVRISRGYMYLDDEDKAISGQQFRAEDGVYEICSQNGSYSILRKRYDRVFASTTTEYRNFIEENKFMLNLMHRLFANR